MKTIENIRRFRLSDSFIEPYTAAEVPWGPLGYVTFKRTYARRLSEFDPEASGSEEWWQTCRRVIEGMFNMQKQHVVRLGLEWNDNKAQKTAKDAFDRLFNLKWTPPGRGLWMMGTKFVEEFNPGYIDQGRLYLQLDYGCSYGWCWRWFRHQGCWYDYY